MAKTNAATNAESQAQATSGEQDLKEANKPEEQDEIQHFDTLITKVVERENEDGETEEVEVLSDVLYPGEQLKKAADDKKYAKKLAEAQQKATDAAEDRK